ncbi:MAG: hypothetical protein ACI9VS_000247 [Candidatus Binatia bacterium]|jgi:hypothetical protein
MTETESNAIRERIVQWGRATPVLQALREEEIRNADTASAMRHFKGSALWSVKHRPPDPTSGLVEQQRWFNKLRQT